VMARVRIVDYLWRVEGAVQNDGQVAQYLGGCWLTPNGLCQYMDVGKNVDVSVGWTKKARAGSKAAASPPGAGGKEGSSTLRKAMNPTSPPSELLRVGILTGFLQVKSRQVYWWVQ